MRYLVHRSLFVTGVIIRIVAKFPYLCIYLNFFLFLPDENLRKTRIEKRHWVYMADNMQLGSLRTISQLRGSLVAFLYLRTAH